MRRPGRGPLLLAAGAAVLVAGLGVLLFAPGQHLKSRLAAVSPGMTRDQVEGVLGPPVLFLPAGSGRPAGTLVWVDQLWQAEVDLGPDGRVTGTGCTPSDSVLRRTVGRVVPLPR